MMNNSLIENNEENYIFFSIGTHHYAFKANCVLAVMQLIELEYPESMPNFIAGLLEFNGQMIKVIDLRKVLNLESGEYSLNSKIIIVKTKNDILGIIVDSINEIRKIQAGLFNTTPYQTKDNLLEAVLTDRDISSAIINLENIENVIHSIKEENNTSLTAYNHMPKDVQSKETLHRRKLHYTRKMREVSNVLIESQDTYITFNLENNMCCLKILHIIGFYKYSSIKLIEIPCTPDFIKGVVNIKGRYITVIDLLKFTEDKTTNITSDATIIVVEYEDYEIGILAGSIGETVDIDENLIKTNIESSKKCLTECVINNSMYLFLDIKKLFSDEKLYIS